jgi:hypothetical protein
MGNNTPPLLAWAAKRTQAGGSAYVRGRCVDALPHCTAPQGGGNFVSCKQRINSGVCGRVTWAFGPNATFRHTKIGSGGKLSGPPLRSSGNEGPLRIAFTADCRIVACRSRAAKPKPGRDTTPVGLSAVPGPPLRPAAFGRRPRRPSVRAQDSKADRARIGGAALPPGAGRESSPGRSERLQFVAEEGKRGAEGPARYQVSNQDAPRGLTRAEPSPNNAGMVPVHRSTRISSPAAR